MPDHVRSFDPTSFMDVASVLLVAEPNQATYRTIAGRCYYAVYGVIRLALCRAKAMRPDQLFGSSGKHGALLRALGDMQTSPTLRQVYMYMAALHRRRVRADYRYRAVESLSRADAEAAMQEAHRALALLQAADLSDFKSVPLD